MAQHQLAFSSIEICTAPHFSLQKAPYLLPSPQLFFIVWSLLRRFHQRASNRSCLSLFLGTEASRFCVCVCVQLRLCCSRQAEGVPQIQRSCYLPWQPQNKTKKKTRKTRTKRQLQFLFFRRCCCYRFLLRFQFTADYSPVYRLTEHQKKKDQ